MMEKTKRKNANPPVQVFQPDVATRFGFVLERK